ncbi:MAG TPA: hypothetical protein VHA14_00360, partial [Bryobacteraceae bacterium]|nr:hypothetical protein [Bryobacteraceae bacterium]
DNLETLKQRGKTLLYTTHYMEEAERLCDRLVVMDHGHVIANDTLHGLYRILPASNVLSVELETLNGAFPLDDLRELIEVQSAEFAGGALRIGVGNLASDTPRVLEWLNARGQSFTHLVTERPDLETVFLTLTGRKLRDS